MNTYLQRQYLETKTSFDKFSSRLLKSQESGAFEKLPQRKQNYLLSRVKKLWERLHVLEIKLKIGTTALSLALLLLFSTAKGQNFKPAPDKNPLPAPSIFGQEPRLVDIDNDGDLDLLLSEINQKIALFKNNGTAANPEFEKIPDNNNPFNSISGEVEVNSLNIIDFGDVDGDNDIDFLLENGYIIKNTGSNSDIIYTPVPTTDYFPYGTRLGDLDGDEDLDLVGLSEYNKVEFYENDGNESQFQINPNIQPVGVANWREDIDYIRDLYLVDVDDDGDLDIIFESAIYSYDPVEGSDYYYETNLLRNIGSATNPAFSLESDTENPYSEIEDRNLAPGDIDNDGDIDIILFSNNSGLKYFETEGSSIAENLTLIPGFNDGIILPSSIFIKPQFIDYDDDGDLDLFVYSYYDYEVFYYEYQETGQQLKYYRIEDKTFPFLDDTTDIQLPYLVDIDMDGDLDVVTLKYNYENEIIFYELARNNGTTAQPEYDLLFLTDLAPEGYSYFPSFIDIDDDGDVDVFFIGNTYYLDTYEMVQYFENTGELQFTSRTGNDNPLNVLNVPKYSERGIFNLVFSDLDKDGDYDLAFNDYYGIISYYENTGSASNPEFTDKSQNGYFNDLSAGYYGQINLVDMDDDGDDDLFLHGYYSIISEYYENTGPLGIGKFQNKLNVSPDIYPNPVLDYLTVRLNLNLTSPVPYQILSSEGKVFIQGTLDNLNQHGTGSLNVSSLPEGLYFLKLTLGDKAVISKFVKR
jgi:hypothetical protein